MEAFRASVARTLLCDLRIPFTGRVLPLPVSPKSSTERYLFISPFPCARAPIYYILYINVRKETRWKKDGL